MKTFLRGILTTWITLLLIIFGFILSFKSIIINMASNIVKEEVTSSIIDTVESTTNTKLPEKVEKKLENTINDNKEINTIVTSSFNIIIDMLNDTNTEANLNIKDNLENIIDVGIDILNDNNITISKSDEEAIKNALSTEEFNTMLTEVSNELKENMDDDTKEVIAIYNFITSSTLKIIIIALIIISLLFIALLKKSYYLWLTNLGISLIIAGTIDGILLPFVINNIILKYTEINLNINALSNNGYLFMIIGLISIIIKQFINILKNKLKKEE